MAARPADAVDRLAETIRRHFVAHPHAADTATGIQTWWLGGRASIVMVEMALERLQRTGYIQEQRLPDGSCLYLAAPPRIPRH
jgi:hypothetical protein